MTPPQATSPSNEAAERLRRAIQSEPDLGVDRSTYADLLDAALSEERRLERERYREVVDTLDRLSRAVLVFKEGKYVHSLAAQARTDLHEVLTAQTDPLLSQLDEVAR